LTCQLAGWTVSGDFQASVSSGRLEIHDQITKVLHFEIDGITHQQGARWNDGLSMPPKVRARLEASTIDAPLSAEGHLGGTNAQGSVPKLLASTTRTRDPPIDTWAICRSVFILEVQSRHPSDLELLVRRRPSHS